MVLYICPRAFSSVRAYIF